MELNLGSDAKFKFELLDVGYDLSVVSFNVSETVSEPYEINLMLAGTDVIKFDDVKLQEGVLTVSGGVGAGLLNVGSGDRYFHGVIRKFKHTGKKGNYELYEAQMVPNLWLLSLKSDCRIFQDQPLKQIIESLLNEQDIASDCYEFRLNREDIMIKFSMQYQETNLNYLSRLLEHEGICYFFEHQEDKHVLVFCDTEAFYREIAGNPVLPFNKNGAVAETEHVYAFNMSERLQPGKLTQRHYNFKTPSVDLTTDHTGESEADFEIYEYPGPYGETGTGNTMSQIRLQELQALAKRGFGDSCCPRFQPGAVFTLTGHSNDTFNGEYFFYALSHEGSQPQTLEEQADGKSSYSNSFLAIPSSVTYRPERDTPPPKVPGLLSAVVTGPEGEEIWPDEYGRVNVQFHWDRLGKKNEKSSCWLRTMQFWNGTTWGSQFIPRIGDEVLISFIDGNMDYPIIMGCAINDVKQPNYSLPVNKTQSGIRTHSTPGGSEDNFNELRFEDKMGSEEIYLQGEKDWNILVKNDKGQNIGRDETLTVANNREKTVGVNQTVAVGANHTEDIGANKKETVGINKMENIGVAKELTIGSLYQVCVGGAMNETVGLAKLEEVGLTKTVFVGVNMTEKIMGNRSITVNKNMSTDVVANYTIKAKTITLDADEGLIFKAGVYSALMTLNSEGEIVIKGATLTENASGEITIKGSKAAIN